MSDPLISCVVPAFNSERYIGEALDSILRQTYRPLEVIVVDDGSTDSTREIAAGCGTEVRVLSQQDQGPAATRSAGVRASRGEFVAFLDADDLWHPEKLARQMARFRARPELALCITHVRPFWSDELDEERRTYAGHPRAGELPGYATPALLARRAVFDRIGLFDPDLWFADATEWFMRAARSGAVMEVLRDVLVYHRLHRANLTRRRSDASRDEFLRVVHESLKRRRVAGQTDSGVDGVSPGRPGRDGGEHAPPD